MTAVAFTPDSKYLVTGCNEGTWAFYDIECEDPASALLMFCKDGHDLGVQGCDISPTTGIFTASGRLSLFLTIS